MCYTYIDAYDVDLEGGDRLVGCDPLTGLRSAYPPYKRITFRKRDE